VGRLLLSFEAISPASESLFEDLTAQCIRPHPALPFVRGEENGFCGFSIFILIQKAIRSQDLTARGKFIEMSQSTGLCKTAETEL